MRVILGIVLGLVAGIAVAVIAGIILGIVTFSPPPGTDPGNIDQLARALFAMPLKAQLAFGAAWLLAGLAGAFVAKTVSQGQAAGWIVALLLGVYFGLSANSLAMSLGIQALWLLAPLAGGLIGNRFGGSRAVPAETAEALPEEP